ncbi:hypothetical protein NA56DRAFT_648313 [Hyaloscypha hepaticicola]|uniref:4Fe-4S ferredoxin-type domain-containing protein n=1 Tax=Hyaloscypha hepaticicola TaxID=2082293 RepID=A0A2J6PV15_9HELO|nr:hypothetical protein NA56DRAFT_648313 [Hyaloscypha hepaticicola]
MYIQALLLASLAGMALTIPAPMVDRRLTGCEFCADRCVSVYNTCVIAAKNTTELLSDCAVAEGECFNYCGECPHLPPLPPPKCTKCGDLCC